MAITHIAKNVASINRIDFQVEANKVTGLTVSAEVNYGTFGRNEDVDVYSKLTSGEKVTLQKFYERIVQEVTQAIIGI